MEKFLTSDADVVRRLSELGMYDYIIIGSGVGGGILADQLAKAQKRVLLIEKGTATFSTHVCNTARPDFSRGKHDSPEGNETIYVANKSWVQTAEDSEPFVGGPLYCLGGRSLVWGLWIPQADTDTLREHYPAVVKDELEATFFESAFNLVTNFSQLEDRYPLGYVSATDLDNSREEVKRAIEKDNEIVPGHTVEVMPIATQLHSPKPYRFPQGAYSTVTNLLNRIYARDKYLSVLMGADVLYLDIPKTELSNHVSVSVNSLTVRIESTQKTVQIATGKAQVILAAGTINTASIALNSGLQLRNPLVGKGLIDHAIWGVRFARRTIKVRDPMNLKTMIKICGTIALLTVTINANFFLAGSSSLPIKQYLETNGDEMSPTQGRCDIKDEMFDTIAVLLEFGAPLEEGNEVLAIPAPNPIIRLKRPNTYGDEDSQKEMQDLATAIRDSVITNVLTPAAKDIPPPGESADKSQLPPLPIPGAPVILPEAPAPRLTLLGAGVFAHEVGTMRMPRPQNPESVVDENLKVRGFANLHVCDMSVLPYSPPANPALTLAALSMRMAANFEPSLMPTMIPKVVKETSTATAEDTTSKVTATKEDAIVSNGSAATNGSAAEPTPTASASEAATS